MIVGPLGEALAGPLKSGEDVLTAEVDLDDCVRGKLDLDVVGHYARADSKYHELNKYHESNAYKYILQFSNSRCKGSLSKLACSTIYGMQS
jgi:hypothetical protein